MRTHWQGHYLDGRTAARQHVSIQLEADRLRLTLEDGSDRWWPYQEIRQTQGFYSGEQIRLEMGQVTPEILIVTDTAFLSTLHRLAPEQAGHFHNPVWRGQRVKLTMLAALFTLCSGAILYLWGIPAFVVFVTPYIPITWEEKLGETIVSQIAPSEKQCQDPARIQLIDRMVSTLITSSAPMPYTFHIVVVNDPMVNALAAPGGYLVIFRGLLEKAQSAEELAGVLAHEIQHVVHRHGTQALLQNLSTGLLVSAIVGDISGLATFGVEGARQLALLRHSRHSEDEADTEGMHMILAAGIDPQGMIRFFESLQQQAAGHSKILTYLSTHPATRERVEKLRALASQAQPRATKLLQPREWQELQQICRP